MGPLGSLLHLLNSDSFFLGPCKPQPRIHPKASAELLASASFNAHLSSFPSMVASFQHLVPTMLCFLGKRRTQPIHICQKQILKLSRSPFSFLFFIGSAICSPGWPGIQDAAQAGFELLLCPHLHSGYGGTYPAGLICLILCSRTLQTLSKFKRSRTSKQSPHPC